MFIINLIVRKSYPPPPTPQVSLHAQLINKNKSGKSTITFNVERKQN